MASVWDENLAPLPDKRALVVTRKSPTGRSNNNSKSSDDHSPLLLFLVSFPKKSLLMRWMQPPFPPGRHDLQLPNESRSSPNLARISVQS